MWILFRLVFSLAIGVARLLAMRGRGTQTVPHGGRTHLLKLHRSKSGMTSFQIGIECRTPVWFRLSRETPTDRFFKRLGVATELQTGDPAFDEQVYVLSDHPAVAKLLCERAETREVVRRMLDEGHQSISSDGRTLWLHRRSTVPPAPTHHDDAARVFDAFEPLTQARNEGIDPFVWRALLLETILYSFAGYIVTLGLSIGPTVHLFPESLVGPGLAFGALLFAALVGAVVVLFRGSSRGMRLIVEAGVILLLCLPPSAVQIFADLNRLLDGSSVAANVAIAGCELGQPKSSNGERGKFPLALAPQARAADVTMPSALQVARPICDAAQQARELHVVLGRGRFGHPWIRELRIGTARWSP